MTTIAVSPEVAAAHAAIQRIVAEHNLPVDVEDPTELTRLPTSVTALVAAAHPAYSVRLSIQLGFVTVSRTGRFGSGNDHTYVNYPVPHTAGDFTERLADEVLPVVRGELERAALERASDHARFGPTAAYEARDAVRRVD